MALWGKNQQRAAAVLLLLAVVAAALAVVVAPVWSASRHYTQTLEEMETRLERLRRAAAARASLRARFEQLEQQQAANVYYLESTSEALAAAELQRVAKQVIVRNQGQLLSTQALPVSEEEGFTRVAVRVRMRAALEGIVQALHAFETGSPLLFLDNVSIRGTSSRFVGRQRRRVAGGGLNVDFELAGYMRKSAS